MRSFPLSFPLFLFWMAFAEARRVVRSVSLLAIAVACSAQSLPAQAVRDSAGIRIVENAQPLWTAREALTLAATPQFVIGDSTDSPSRFRRIRGTMRLSDGRIAVVDGGSLELRFFSADGRFLAAKAGRGEAPGQLRNIGLVRRLVGDSIAISSSFATMNLYTNTGDFVRTIQPAVTADDRPANLFVLIDVLGNGRRVVSPLPNPQPKPMGMRWVDSLPLQMLGRDNENSVSLGSAPYIELEQLRTQPTSPWLSAIGAFASGHDRFFAGFGDRFQINVFNGEGTPHSIIRRSWTPTPITPAEWEEWVVQWSKLWVKATGSARDSAVDVVRRATYAEELPAFSAFLVDRTGRLWVRSAHWQDAIGAGSYTDIPAVPSQWSVFDTLGRWLGDVEMPSNFQPFEIGADYVIGESRRNGFAQVAVYALR